MTPTAPLSPHEPAIAAADLVQFVTVRLGGQLIGVPIDHVRDVFQIAALTPVPLAPQGVAGLANLRGRIILLVDLAAELGLVSQPAKGARLAVGIEWRGETLGLLVDAVGDVVSASPDLGAPVSALVQDNWSRCARRIFNFERDVMIELDLNALLDSPLTKAA